jgi:nicotinamidase-related amidase
MPLPPHRALIVIDVQNEYVSGNLRIEYPPLDLSLAHIGLAIDAAHAAGVPVIVVQNHAPVGSPLFALGSHGWQLHPAVASRPHSHRVEKTLPSAFAHTDLGPWLAHHEIDTLTIAGYMTHNCDAATAFEAMHRGLIVEFLVDATGAVPYKNDAGAASAEDIHRVFSVVLHSRFAAVVTTQAWIEAVRSGQALPRSSIYESHRAARH